MTILATNKTLHVLGTLKQIWENKIEKIKRLTHKLNYSLSEPQMISFTKENLPFSQCSLCHKHQLKKIPPQHPTR